MTTLLSKKTIPYVKPEGLISVRVDIPNNAKTHLSFEEILLLQVIRDLPVSTSLENLARLAAEKRYGRPSESVVTYALDVLKSKIEDLRCCGLIKQDGKNLSLTHVYYETRLVGGVYQHPI